MTVIALLNLPPQLPDDAEVRAHGLETFADRLPEHLSNCKDAHRGPFSLYCLANILGVGQSFEGGIAAYPGTEAHGAYAYCVLACLAVLGEPHKMFSE